MEYIPQIITIVIEFLLSAINITINYHFAMSNDELRDNTISEKEFCDKINPFVKVEIILVALMSVIFVISRSYIEILIMIPFVIYFAYQYYKKRLFIKPINARDYLERNDSTGYKKMLIYLVIVLILLTRLVIIYLDNFEIKLFKFN